MILRTYIGDPAPTKRNSAEAHGAPLGAEEVRRTKEIMGWPAEPAFFVPGDALAHWRTALDRGAALESEWDDRLKAYATDHPDLAVEYQRWMSGDLPEGWDRGLPALTHGDGPIATRQASGLALQALASAVPNLIGGSADLGGSTGTTLKHENKLRPHQLGPGLPLGRSGARDGRDPQRHRGARRTPAVRQHLPGVFRLHEAGDPPVGDHAACR